ncbi:MAG: uracil-DNA glycosylase [Synergistaceae bacterium]|nr:uracil-DNA glycosylase [Synergistaceae bacterium]
MSIDITLAWKELQERVRTCQKCNLCETRHNTVFGEGLTEGCRVVIIGEAPGEDEDMSGRPFVGRAGQLLTDILEKGGGIPRSSVYIANTIKCRPPGNKDPNMDQLLACNEHLEAQLLLLHPQIIVTMGNVPTQWLTKSKLGITKMRGQWLEWRGIKLFPMFHPSYLLRNETRAKGGPKDLTWHDIRALKAKIDELERS